MKGLLRDLLHQHTMALPSAIAPPLTPVRYLSLSNEPTPQQQRLEIRPSNLIWTSISTPATRTTEAMVATTAAAEATTTTKRAAGEKSAAATTTASIAVVPKSARSPPRLPSRPKDSWPFATYVPMKVYLSTDENAKPITLNLVDHMGPRDLDYFDRREASVHRSRLQSETPRGLVTKFYLSDAHHENTTVQRKRVIQYVKKFLQHAPSWENTTGGCVLEAAWKHYDQRLDFACTHGRRTSMGNSRAPPLVMHNLTSCITITGNDATTSAVAMTDRKGTKADSSSDPPRKWACPFAFSIKWEPSLTNPESGRWYFYEHGFGCRFHVGHGRPPVIPTPSPPLATKNNMAALRKHKVKASPVLPVEAQMANLQASHALVIRPNATTEAVVVPPSPGTSVKAKVDVSEDDEFDDDDDDGDEDEDDDDDDEDDEDDSALSPSVQTRLQEQQPITLNKETDSDDQMNTESAGQRAIITRPLLTMDNVVKGIKDAAYPYPYPYPYYYPNPADYYYPPWPPALPYYYPNPGGVVFDGDVVREPSSAPAGTEGKKVVGTAVGTPPMPLVAADAGAVPMPLPPVEPKCRRPRTLLSCGCLCCCKIYDPPGENALATTVATTMTGTAFGSSDTNGSITTDNGGGKDPPEGPGTDDDRQEASSPAGADTKSDPKPDVPAPRTWFQPENRSHHNNTSTRSMSSDECSLVTASTISTSHKPGLRAADPVYGQQQARQHERLQSLSLWVDETSRTDPNLAARLLDDVDYLVAKYERLRRESEFHPRKRQRLDQPL